MGGGEGWGGVRLSAEADKEVAKNGIRVLISQGGKMGQRSDFEREYVNSHDLL